MSKRSEILELLTKNDLTTKEIQKKTDYDMDLIWQYINQFKKEKKIEQIRKKGRFAVYTIIKKNNQENIDTEILKKMLPKFIDLEVYLEDTTEIEDKRIGELIKQCRLI